MFCDVNAKVIMGGVLISLSFECVIQIWGMSTVVAQFWGTIISPQWTPYHPDLSEPSEFTQNWGNDMNHPELRESLLNHPDFTHHLYLRVVIYLIEARKEVYHTLYSSGVLLLIPNSKKPPNPYRFLIGLVIVLHSPNLVPDCANMTGWMLTLSYHQGCGYCM